MTSVRVPGSRCGDMIDFDIRVSVLDSTGSPNGFPPAETFELPLNRPRAGACSFPGFLPAAMFVAGIWSTGTYPTSLGFAKAGPRSGAGTGN